MGDGGDSCIAAVTVTSCTSVNSRSLSALFSSPPSAAFLDQPFSHPSRQQPTGPSRNSDLGKGCDTPLSPSHARDKGYYNCFSRKNALGLVGGVDSTIKALAGHEDAVIPLVLSQNEISRSGHSAIVMMATVYLKSFAVQWLADQTMPY